ncbi:hypothetical protein [Pseudomonas chlororaphis]|uniref:hypothetical protein n=1 Tax=Pseudomonas chlororaphis TaxID=587753 RepID=UPI002365D737|nr:hypothetical protein [Pseudomonas chlororaphis]WDH22466.1 hypothetical protein PUP50_31660 [Pseudomonas chlororaphis]
MLSCADFVLRAFQIAEEMTKESLWASHVLGVDKEYIRFKNGKNVTAEKLGRMWPELLQDNITTESANAVIGAVTKHQTCVNVPMAEIARRIREE